MARIISCLTCFVFIVMTGHRDHPKFAKAEDDIPTPSIVACSEEHSREQNNIIEQSKCDKPKEVFEYLIRNGTNEQVNPNAIWVKRCVGLCDYDNEGTCVATETTTRNVNVRVYNLKTNKESCATYPITEHVTCGCPLKPDK